MIANLEPIRCPTGRETAHAPAPVDAARLAAARQEYRAVAHCRAELAAARTWAETMFARRSLALAQDDLEAAVAALLGEGADRG